MTIAEIYEAELVDIEKVCGSVCINMSFLYLFHVFDELMKDTVFLQAIAHYEQAADYYKGEESNR